MTPVKLKQTMESPLLAGHDGLGNKNKSIQIMLLLLAFMALSFLGHEIRGNRNIWAQKHDVEIKTNHQDTIESELGVVAADDSRCSEIGASFLRRGGHAVDAAVATSLCIGVVHQTSSGIGGGSFMVVRSSKNSRIQAFDMRETAPLASSQNMYQNKPEAKGQGGLSVGVPGELAGLYEAWLQHGRIPWRDLFQPAINLAKNGFEVSPYLGNYIAIFANKVMEDPGLRDVYAPNGNLLKAGETCYNAELGRSLEVVAEQGPQAFYNGTIGEKLVKDVREAGGILTMEDLRSYKVEVTDALTVNVMGHTIYGMPPPSSGTLALAMVMNILDSYGSSDAAKGEMGVHRLIEALKHTMAIRMNLGDPNFVNITSTVLDMLSPSFARKIKQMILDNTTFPPQYYMSRWAQVRDHGTSHFCIVDADRNALSMTTSVNWVFGAGLLSPSTGIVLNNEMDDFSIPTYVSPEKLPPAPSNFIQPNKRPLSSMTPIIVTKDDQLVGVIGGSGGLYIISAMIQVFINHFVLGMDPQDSVQSPRIYHTLIPNVVKYENLTGPYGDHIEVSEKIKHFLKDKGHQLKRAEFVPANTQLIVHDLKNPISVNRKISKKSNSYTMHGTLTAVSDPRKGGCPAAI